MSWSTREIRPGGGSSSSSMFPGRHDFDFGPRRSESVRRPSANIDPFERRASSSPGRPSFTPEPRRGGFSNLPGADFLSTGASGRRGAVVDDSFERRSGSGRAMFSDPYDSMPSRDIGAGTGYRRYRNDAPPTSYSRYESRPTTSSSRRPAFMDDPFARQAASSSRYGSTRESSRYPPSSYDRYAEPRERRTSSQRFTDQYYSGSSFEMRGHRDDPYSRSSRSGSTSGRRNSSSGSRWSFF